MVENTVATTLATRGDSRRLSRTDDVSGRTNIIINGCKTQIPIRVTTKNSTNLRTWLLSFAWNVKFLLMKKLAIRAIVVEQ